MSPSQAYTSLMGLVVMDEDLKIRNYNHNFISLSFGYEKGALIDRVSSWCILITCWCVDLFLQ